MAKKTFQQELKETIVDRVDPKLSRKEVLEDIFKTYVAKMMEANVMANKNRMEAGYMHMIKTYMINEFRGAELSEHQMSEEWYSNLFDSTIREILNSASAGREENSVTQTQEIIKNPNAMRQTKSGLWVPR